MGIYMKAQIGWVKIVIKNVSLHDESYVELCEFRGISLEIN